MVPFLGLPTPLVAINKSSPFAQPEERVLGLAAPSTPTTTPNQWPKKVTIRILFCKQTNSLE